jgi:hypothetical protein
VRPILDPRASCQASASPSGSGRTAKKANDEGIIRSGSSAFVRSCTNYEMLFDGFSRAATLLVSTVYCFGFLFRRESVLLGTPVDEFLPRLLLSLVELESYYYARSIKLSFPTTPKARISTTIRSSIHIKTLHLTSYQHPLKPVSLNQYFQSFKMPAPKPTADDHTASFFQDVGLKGTKLVRQANGVPVYEAPKQVAELYKSLSVGLGSKAHFWHGKDTTQRKELEANDYNDLKAKIGDVTSYSVDPDDTTLIEFTFVDGTGKKPGAFVLNMKVYNVGEVDALSDDGKYHVAGKISEQTGDVITAVRVRDETSKEYIDNGSIFFFWDKETASVKIDEGKGQWPKNLKIEQVNADQFKVTLLPTHPPRR